MDLAKEANFLAEEHGKLAIALIEIRDKCLSLEDAKKIADDAILADGIIACEE